MSKKKESYPFPCDTCPKNETGCRMYRKCDKWRARYLYRQKQINAYAKKVLPGYYERMQKEALQNERNEANGIAI